MNLLKRLFRRRATAFDDQLAAATAFRSVVERSAFGVDDLTVTVQCGGYQAEVTVRPKDGLVQYLYNWAAGVVFQVRTQGFAETEMSGRLPVDPEVRRDIEAYLRFWASICIKEGTFPVAMISRREPDIQHLIVVPGYSERLIKDILEHAKTLANATMTHIQIN